MDKKLFRYLPILVCPRCKSTLNNQTSGLYCSRCSASYRVFNHIPVLVDDKAINKHLSGQIEYFENEEISNRPQYLLESWQKSYLKRFLDNIPDIRNKKILDCGTGSGYMAIELAKLGAEVVACDLTLKSLTRLQKIIKELKLSEKITLVCCTGESLPLRDNTFDIIISNAVLEHIPQERQAIGELKRIAKRKSQIMVAVPIKFKYLFPILKPVNWLHDRRIGHLRRYDLASIKRKFGGWKINKVYYTGHINKVIKILINRLVNLFDYDKIESEDNHLSSTAKFSSNIICFLSR